MKSNKDSFRKEVVEKQRFWIISPLLEEKWCKFDEHIFLRWVETGYLRPKKGVQQDPKTLPLKGPLSYVFDISTSRSWIPISHQSVAAPIPW